MTENKNIYAIWPEMLLFYGTVPKSITYHQHPVIQLVIGVDEPYLRKEISGEWTSVRALLIKQNIAHECDATNKKIFSLNIEPDSSLGFFILKNHLKNKNIIEINDDFVNRLNFLEVETFIKSEDLDVLSETIENAFGFEQHKKYFFSSDDRIEKIRKYICENIHQRFTTKELSDLVFLSESRMLYLFKEQMGLPIRNYILWIRIKRSVKKIMDGHNLTEASHIAGFSDSAHMSRTYVKVLGLTPTLVQKNSKFIQVFLSEAV